MQPARILRGRPRSVLERCAHTLPEYVEIHLTFQQRVRLSHAQTEWHAKRPPYCDRDCSFRTTVRRSLQVEIRRRCCPVCPYPATRSRRGAQELPQHAQRTALSLCDIYSWDCSPQ